MAPKRKAKAPSQRKIKTLQRKTKRKDNALPKHRSASLLSKLGGQPEMPSRKATSLLDLPAEIRNLIYEYVALGTSIPIPSSSPRPRTPFQTMTTSSNLSRTNRQVRQEFFGIAAHTAKFITKVQDFHFRHIVSFLNNLSYEELDAAASAGRDVTVVLSVTARCLALPSGLMSWVRRMDGPRAKGTKLTYIYRWSKPLERRRRLRGIRTVPRPQKPDLHGLDMMRLEDKWSRMGPGNALDELYKIMRRLRSY